MRVGDLVRYWLDPLSRDVGIIVKTDFDHVASPVPYKVRWTDNHEVGNREWFREEELVKL